MGDECGTESRNRLFAEVDDTLVSYIRNHNILLPTWHAASDSPHKAFTNVTEQSPLWGSLNNNLDAGGQVQFYQFDGDPNILNCQGTSYGTISLWDCLCFARGLSFACTAQRPPTPPPAYAPRIIEFDVDFDVTHESSMTCSYNSEVQWRYGVTKYQWGWNNIVTPGNTEYGYNPCTSPSSSGSIYCVDAPEGSTATLGCPTGVINWIGFASYGAPDTFTCGSYWASACNSSISPSVVQNACLNRSSCAIAVNNGSFGDPCPDMYGIKKLGVQYTCGSLTCTPDPDPCATLGYSCGTADPILSARRYGRWISDPGWRTRSCLS